MRKLTRGEEPGCLRKFKHGRDNWGSVTLDDKIEIWIELNKMQGGLCAYCESAMGGAKHIEHFRQKDRVPAETFLWSNLFGSCNNPTSCGKSKDSDRRYRDDELIKPDINDPDQYFLFVQDGSIKLKNASESKGRETLRVFGLNPDFGRLRDKRREAIRRHMGTIAFYSDLCQQDPHNELDWHRDLEADLDKVAGEEFSTAIRHVYRDFLPILD